MIRNAWDIKSVQPATWCVIMFWHRSAHSTSSTSLPTQPREVLDLSPLAVVHSIYSALVAKSYHGVSSTHTTALDGFSDRLLKQVQREVRAVSRRSYLDNKIDWEVQVFKPIIATFEIQDDLGIYRGDAEYVFLLATVLMLAYELLLMASKSTAPKTRSFLARAFAEYFVEPEICCQVAEVLEAERKRLAEGLADMKVLRAVQDMGGLLPSTELYTAA
jgi:hypothetical protein